MREVKLYNPNGACLVALNPSCGYCPGEIYGERCYVPHDQYRSEYGTDYRELYK